MKLLTERRVLTWAGVSPEDWIAAIAAIEESSEIPDKRILSCRVAHPGDILLVHTGEGRGGCAGGGCDVLLERSESGWKIAEITDWRS